MVTLQSIDSEIRNHLSQLQQRVYNLPPEVKVLIGFLPGGGSALSSTDLVMEGYCRMAEHYRKLKQLPLTAAHAFHDYESVMIKEREARARFLREFHAFLEKQPAISRMR